MVEQRAPEKNKYLGLWVTKLGFSGNLSVAELKKLNTQIKKKSKGKKRRLQKLGKSEAEWWLEAAVRRENGQNKAKAEKRKKDNEVKITLLKKEEDVIRKKPDREPRQEAESSDDEEEETNTNGLYPDLRELFHSPPPPRSPPPSYRSNRALRSTGPVGDWSKKMGGELEPPSPQKPTNPFTSPFCTPGHSNPPEAYPMIEVPNPHGNGDGTPGNPPTTLVYRTWTLEDVKAALAGLSPFPENVEDAIEGLRLVRQTYHLNGAEVQQIWMTHAGRDWHKIRGDWNPADIAQRPLPPTSNELGQRLTALEQRARVNFTRRADYSVINQTKQKPGEPWDEFSLRMRNVFRVHSGLNDDNNDRGPYRQQLKNALHQGCLPQVHHWVNKHFVAFPDSSVSEYETQARHAQRLSQNKATQKPSAPAGTYLSEDPQEQVYYCERRDKPQRGRGKGRNQADSGMNGDAMSVENQATWQETAETVLIEDTSHGERKTAMSHPND